MKKHRVIFILISIVLLLSSCSHNTVFKDDVSNVIIDGTWSGTCAGKACTAEIKGNAFRFYMEDDLMLDTEIYNYLQDTTGGQMIFYHFKDDCLKDPYSKETLYYIEDMYVRGLFYDRESHTDKLYPLSIDLAISSSNHVQNHNFTMSKIS